MPGSRHSANHDYQPIHAYGLIGDCRSAGLVSLDGSLDWLCFPRFDSPSIFAALLDPVAGGRFRIRPTGQFQAERRYLPGTNILEVTFRSETGTCMLRDLMPVASEEDKRSMLTPEHEILREVEGVSGTVELEIVYEPRPQYGRLRPRLQQRGRLGIWCDAHGALLTLRSEFPLHLAPDHLSASTVTCIRTGERKYLSLTYSEEGPAVFPLLGDAARAKLEQTTRWWQRWADRCGYRGPYRDAVVRSALALKLMTYAPSGAIVAAPTTSLPEQVGGPRNWDYRYCWLRDASFTLRALFTLGYTLEAEAFLNWMLHATRLTWPELQILYDVYGEAHVGEEELAHLTGYAGSRPVRIGNQAYDQLQLDVYGEVLDAVALVAPHLAHFDRDTIRLLNGLGQTVCRRWREPDEGIWEGRGGRFQHTHSKVLCWVALDRLIQLHTAGYHELPVDHFREHRDALHQAIEMHGYNEHLGSYTRTFDGDAVDGSLLVLPLYGYIDATHPRMRSTFERVKAQLAHGSLFYRYASETDDGLSGGEGAFGMCSFWAVEYVAKRGDVPTATRMFEELLTYGNDVGLFAEEIDPVSGAALGNFPQAFTHIGLINAALTLQQCSQNQHQSEDITVTTSITTETSG